MGAVVRAGRSGAHPIVFSFTPISGPGLSGGIGVGTIPGSLVAPRRARRIADTTRWAPVLIGGTSIRTTTSSLGTAEGHERKIYRYDHREKFLLHNWLLVAAKDMRSARSCSRRNATANEYTGELARQF